MSLHAMDTHKAVQEFLDAGVEQPLAEVMVAAIDGAVSEHMLTKDELEAVKAAAIEELANKADLEAIAGELHTVTDDVAALKGDTAMLKKDVAVLKSDTAVLKDDVAVLKSDTAVLKDDVAVLKGDTAMLKKDVAVLNVKVDGLESTMQQHREESRQHRTEFKQHRENFAQHQLENQAEHARLDASIKSEIGKLRDDMAQWKSQLLIFLGGGLLASTVLTVTILGFLLAP